MFSEARVQTTSKKVISYLWEFDIDFLKLSQWLEILFLI